MTLDIAGGNSASPERPGRFVQYGAIPWRHSKHGDLRILLITSRGRKRWIVPKGWPIAGKTPGEVAAREAFEEAGVFGEMTAEAVGSFGYSKVLRDGSNADCTVRLFGLNVRGTWVNWPERAERKRQWVGLDEAIDLVGDCELARLMETMRGECLVAAEETAADRLRQHGADRN